MVQCNRKGALFLQSYWALAFFVCQGNLVCINQESNQLQLEESKTLQVFFWLISYWSISYYWTHIIKLSHLWSLIKWLAFYCHLQGVTQTPKKYTNGHANLVTQLSSWKLILFNILHSEGRWAQTCQVYLHVLRSW